MSSLKKSKELIDKTVANAEGFVIGTVNDYLIDVQSWQVSDLQIKIDKAVAKELGLKAPMFGSLLVLVSVSEVRSMSDQVIVGLTKAAFAGYIEARKKEG